MTLRLLVRLARILLLPVVLLASLCSGQVVPVGPEFLFLLGYAACLTGLAAWPRRSLRRIALPIAGWLMLCWATTLPHGGTVVQLVALLGGCLACAIPRAMRDFQRLARSNEHMTRAELRLAQIRDRAPTRSASRFPGASAPDRPSPRLPSPGWDHPDRSNLR